VPVDQRRARAGVLSSEVAAPRVIATPVKCCTDIGRTTDTEAGLMAISSETPLNEAKDGGGLVLSGGYGAWG
jgi:hypothetical protein